MKFCVVSIRDDKVGFLQPTFDINTASAVRSFSDAVKSTDYGFRLHPGDFSLYHVGYFDSESGALESFDVPVFLATGSDFGATGGDN